MWKHCKHSASENTVRVTQFQFRHCQLVVYIIMEGSATTALLCYVCCGAMQAFCHTKTFKARRWVWVQRCLQ